MVVPPGLATMSLSLPGCSPVSNTSFAAPRTVWAASFVGEANLIHLEQQKEEVITPLGKMKLSKYSEAKVQTLMIRPEAIRIEKPQDHLPNGCINSIEFAGSVQDIRILLNNRSLA